MTGADMQRVGAGRGGPDRDLAALAKGQAAGEEILHREPVHDRQIRQRAFHRAQHIETEARAIFQAAAIFVGAAVLEWCVELRDQIAMRGVNFDAIETGRLRTPRGGNESCNRLLDARSVIFCGTMVSNVVS